MSLTARLLPGVPYVESPLFYSSLDDMHLTPQERDAAIQLNERGYAVIDFPDDDILARIDRVVADLSPHFGVNFDDPDSPKNTGNMRIQDAWRFHDDVREIACNQAVLDLLAKLYGRRAFPFQTLNFPVGTQQHVHSDSIHFSSIPERFMCGVWLAMEDIQPDAGPLMYYPGSHKWPILYNEALSRDGAERALPSPQSPYEPVWRAMLAETGLQPETFLARKGQALIWAANLLHGGSQQINKTRTRWSQVTHYYFENCSYFTPAFSNPMAGQLDLREIHDMSRGEVAANTYLGRPMPVASKRADAAESKKGNGMARFFFGGAGDKVLPDDFDPERYLALNRDVAASKMSPAQHFLRYGRAEKRRYK